MYGIDLSWVWMDTGFSLAVGQPGLDDQYSPRKGPPGAFPCPWHKISQWARKRRLGCSSSEDVALVTKLATPLVGCGRHCRWPTIVSLVPLWGCLRSLRRNCPPLFGNFFPMETRGQLGFREPCAVADFQQAVSWCGSWRFGSGPT